MKKIFFATATALLLATAALQAQTSFVAYSADSHSNAAKTATAPVSPSMDSLARKNPKAFDDFSAKYGTAMEVSVSTESNNTVIVFTNAGIMTRVYYTTNGLHTCTLRYYTAAGLPANIAKRIRAEFPGYSAFGVVELNNADKTAYLVKIENQKYWKTVQVIDGDTFVTEQYKK